MNLDSRHWVLFGYDLRSLGGAWRVAWRDLLWNPDSRLRALLDEPVCVYSPREQTNASQLVGRTQGKEILAEAQRLPDEMVLSLWLNLPEQAEAELESALTLEVRAKSPYPMDDTCYGWRVASRQGGVLRVCLVIVSRSGVLAYLHRFLDVDQASHLEVWARVEDLDLVIQGFGEGARERRYQTQLKRLLAWCGYALLISILLMFVPVVLRGIQVEHYRQELEEVQRQSVEAVRLRNQLAQNNERVQEIQRLLNLAGDPYSELLRLTYLLNDGVWLTAFDYKGDRMRIEGMADNAAELMQLLSEQPHYTDVRAPSAIRRDQRSSQERFVLDISFAPQGVKP